MKKSRGVWQRFMHRHVIACGLVSVLFSCPSPAENVAPSMVQYSIDLPVEPLRDALSQLAGQMGFQVLAASALVEGLRSNEVRGSFSAEEALRRVLANSGLQFTFVNPHTVAINRIETPAGSDQMEPLSDDRTKGLPLDQGKKVPAMPAPTDSSSISTSQRSAHKRRGLWSWIVSLFGGVPAGTAGKFVAQPGVA